MCGIVGAVSTRNIVPILVEGLKRLEYRGYDSCGVAVHQGGELQRARSTRAWPSSKPRCRPSIAAGHRHRPHPLGHPRRAGGAQRAPAFLGPGRVRRPAQAGRIALVHNGIIENHEELRAELKAARLRLRQPDRHRGHRPPGRPPVRRRPVRGRAAAVPDCSGAYAIAVFCRDEPHRVVGAREGSPLVLGVGTTPGENFLASDAMALAGVTDQIVYLEEGDVVDLQLGKLLDRRPAAGGKRRAARGAHGAGAQRRGRTRPLPPLHAKGNLRTAARHRRHAGRRARHQARTVRRRRLPRLQGSRRGADPGLRHQLLRRLHRQVLAGVDRQDPDQVEIASEYRYRDSVPNPRTLVVTISQIYDYMRQTGKPNTISCIYCKCSVSGTGTEAANNEKLFLDEQLPPTIAAKLMDNCHSQAP